MAVHITYKKEAVVLLFAVALHLGIYGQQPAYPTQITDIAEELAIESDDPESVSVFLEILDELYKNPVKINESGEEELSRLFFLSGYQIKSLLYHISTTGSIQSVYEIASVPGIDRLTVELMVPFISLEKGATTVAINNRTRAELISSLIFKPGETDTTTPGSELKSLTKFNLTTGKFQGGFTLEKDAGERFIGQNPKRPEFLSAHLAYNGSGVIRQIILGDFSAKFGLGTNLNTRFGTALSPTATNLMVGKDEIKPYTSTDENNFFRGIASHLTVGGLNASLFLSRNQLDATLGISNESGSEYIENLYLAGYHNSQPTLEKKDVVTSTVFGTNLYYNLRSSKIGFTYSRESFSLPFFPDKNDPSKLYGFSGTDNQVFSAYYRTVINKITLFGEASTNDFSNLALVQGINIRPTDRLAINFIYRDYSPSFTTFHGRGPGASSSTNNEKGLFGNLSLEIYKHLFLVAGADISQMPWLGYRKNFPSLKIKEEIKLEFGPTDNASMEIGYALGYSEFNGTDGTGMPSKEAIETGRLNFVGSFSTENGLTLKTRVGYKLAKPSGEQGLMVLQDINYVAPNIPLSLWFRFGIFNTEGWDSRLYAYENDLLNSFSVPALSGRGTRSYLMVKYNLGRYVEIRVKYGVTTTLADNGQSGGTDELRIQLRIGR